MDPLMTTVALELAAEVDKSVLARLLELEAHDLSEYEEALRVNAHGFFGYPYLDHYWAEHDRFPYFIRVGAALVGLCLVRTLEDRIEMAEFFVLRSHRRDGVGAAAAAQVFSLHPGPWQVEHAVNNGPAASFWKRVISEAATGAIDRRDLPGGRVVYRFTTT